MRDQGKPMSVKGKVILISENQKVLLRASSSDSICTKVFSMVKIYSACSSR